MLNLAHEVHDEATRRTVIRDRFYDLLDWVSGPDYHVGSRWAFWIGRPLSFLLMIPVIVLVAVVGPFVLIGLGFLAFCRWIGTRKWVARLFEPDDPSSA